ncbi:MAG: mechanosensitive ion channel family protein [Prevotellaceae bacterium]|nr:mechanosensitive ion channel family protein [Prevotellaceae bacterium]
MLDEIFWSNSVRDWGISLIIVIGTIFVVNKLIIYVNRNVLQKIAAKSKNQLDDLLLSSLEKPVLVGVTLGALLIATTRLTMEPKMLTTIENAFKILIAINITWLISKFANALISEYGKRVDNKLLPLIRRTVLILVWVIGVVTALNNVGIEIDAILGTLGIGGVAVALAAQDTIKNIFGGITIYTDAPFRIGDIVQFDSYEGTVQDIGVRSTRILTYEQRLVTVPNYKLMDASVVNISAEPSRRVVIKLGLTYDTSPQKMKEAIDLLKELPENIENIEANTVAVFSDFGDSALLITYIYYIKKGLDIRESNSLVNFEILNRFNDAGLNFAFPTQTVYIEKIT